MTVLYGIKPVCVVSIHSVKIDMKTSIQCSDCSLRLACVLMLLFQFEPKYVLSTFLQKKKSETEE